MSNKKQLAENEMDEVIKRRVYGMHIPEQIAHGFRSKVTSDSGPNCPPIPEQIDQ